MKIRLLPLLLLGCTGGDASDKTSTDDSGASGDGAWVGLDTSSWVLATQLPEPGAAIHHRSVAGGRVGDGDTLDGHLSDVFVVAASGEVLCAWTHAVASTQRLSGEGCDGLWAADWSLPVGHGTSFCMDVLGYDPLSIDLSFYDAFGWHDAGGDARLCLREEGSSVELIEGYDWEVLEDDTFVMSFEEALSL